MENNIMSNLVLQELFFDKILFERIEWNRNDNDISFTLSLDIANKIGEETYKIELSLKGKKDEEFIIELVLVGIFSLENSEDLNPEFKETIIRENTVAIMLPYMRSQVAILTVQPGLDSVTLPIFNVSSMFRTEQFKYLIFQFFTEIA